MEKNKKYGIYKTLMLIIMVAFITFTITSISLYTYFTKNPIIVTSDTKTTNKDISKKLESYRKIIDKYYLGDIDESKLEEGAIKGYIEGLGDPYTEYISKEDMKDYIDDTLGNFVGIGIYMVKNTKYDKIQVLSTIKEGINYVKEIDLAMTELKKVTDESEASYNNFLQTASKKAGTIG